MINSSNNITRISIQVSLSGFSFRISSGQTETNSGWLDVNNIFTSPELQKRYDEVEVSLLSPKFALVPAQFFDPSQMRQALEDVVSLAETDSVSSVPVPEYGAVLVYSNSIGESLSNAVAQTVVSVSGDKPKVLPEIYYILRDLSSIKDYNRILASYMDGWLHLAIAQGKSLLLCNSYEAVDFTTAEYFIFLAMKKLQLNPEVSSIYFRTPLSTECEMSLYRYFKSVEVI